MIILIATNCKKEVAEKETKEVVVIEIPTVTTASVESITQTSANCGGVITSNGGDIITASGVCWSNTPNPTIDNNKTSDSIINDSFISEIDGLTANSSYYVRAYASNSQGIAYGNEIQFSTLPDSIPVQYDSIPLSYVDCTDAPFIILFENDSIIIWVESWIEYNGPHPYENTRIWIKSNNPNKIKLSYGKNHETTLEKDSLIDESLAWFGTYISCGYIVGIIGIDSEYVGIKIVDKGKTYFGWIHKPTCYRMTEFAIDTSSVANRKIYAGSLKK